jgi:hypothetical protein
MSFRNPEKGNAQKTRTTSPSTRGPARAKQRSMKRAVSPQSDLTEVQITSALYQPHKSSPVIYLMVLGAFVLIGAVYVVYTSTSIQQSVYEMPNIDEWYEATSTKVVQSPTAKAPPPEQKPNKPAIRPNAVINVPSVSLRATPDVKAKPLSSSVKNGEGVEIIKRHSGNGPEWVKIQTRSGQTGWVFGSVVKERKGG